MHSQLSSALLLFHTHHIHRHAIHSHGTPSLSEFPFFCSLDWWQHASSDTLTVTHGLLPVCTGETLLQIIVAFSVVNTRLPLSSIRLTDPAFSLPGTHSTGLPNEQGTCFLPIVCHLFTGRFFCCLFHQSVAGLLSCSLLLITSSKLTPFVFLSSSIRPTDPLWSSAPSQSAPNTVRSFVSV